MTESPETPIHQDTFAQILDASVEGRHLEGPRLADNLRGGPHFLVFLRHFG